MKSNNDPMGTYVKSLQKYYSSNLHAINSNHKQKYNFYSLVRYLAIYKIINYKVK